jgi:TIR domain
MEPRHPLKLSMRMTKSSDMKRWLEQAGFRNYCFVSYPHQGGAQMTEFAERMRYAIEDELKTQITNPSVYLDTTHIAPGAVWPESLRQNLCASVAMVAILAPIYLEEEHEWCGREWAAMDKLGQMRLPDTSIKPIIPVFFRKTELPAEAGARQPIDLSRISLKGRRYYSTEEFRSAVLKIVNQIFEIAALIQQNDCRAEVDSFEFPSRSPFIQSPVQPPPLRNH